jgi:hypothetical protein
MESAAAGLAGDASRAFRTVRTGQPEWLDHSRRCPAVLDRAQHAAEAVTVADRRAHPFGEAALGVRRDRVVLGRDQERGESWWHRTVGISHPNM